MATEPKPDIENPDRRAAVASALASLGMEGLAPDAETSALLAQYEGGSITLQEFGRAIERHVAQMGDKIGASKPVRGVA